MRDFRRDLDRNTQRVNIYVKLRENDRDNGILLVKVLNLL